MELNEEHFLIERIDALAEEVRKMREALDVQIQVGNKVLTPLNHLVTYIESDEDEDDE